MKEKEICPASGNCQKQFLKGEVTCKTCRRRKRDMAPKTGKAAPPPPPPPPDETGGEETVTDSFDNTGLKLWWVPMEFTRTLEDGSKTRFTFEMKVAGDDEEDARGNAGIVSLSDLLPDLDLETSDDEDVQRALDDGYDTCNATYEDWDDEDIELQANDDADVEECFD